MIAPAAMHPSESRTRPAHFGSGVEGRRGDTRLAAMRPREDKTHRYGCATGRHSIPAASGRRSPNSGRPGDGDSRRKTRARPHARRGAAGKARDVSPTQPCPPASPNERRCRRPRTGPAARRRLRDGCCRPSNRHMAAGLRLLRPDDAFQTTPHPPDDARELQTPDLALDDGTARDALDICCTRAAFAISHQAALFQRPATPPLARRQPGLRLAAPVRLRSASRFRSETITNAARARRAGPAACSRIGRTLKPPAADHSAAFRGLARGVRFRSSGA